MKQNVTPPLTCIYFYPTESCNLKCRHCWIAPSFAEKGSSDAYTAQNKSNLTFDEVQTVIEDALPLGLNSIKITGGEPFLHPQIMDYLHLFKKKGLALTLETNGTLLGEDSIKELKKLSCATSISIDGATAKTHDRVRGVKGSFDRTMHALRLMKKHDYPCEVIFSLYKDTLPDLIKIIEFLNDLKGFFLKINILSPIGRGKTLKETSGDIGIETLLALNKRIEDHYRQRYTNVAIQLHIPTAFYSTKSLLKDMCCHCRIFNIIGLLSDGKVSYCGIGRLEKDLILGDIRKQRLHKIWTGSPKLRAFRQDMPTSLKGVCGMCIHRNQCLGSCIAQTYALTKDLYAPFSFCETAYQKGLFPQSRLITKR